MLPSPGRPNVLYFYYTYNTRESTIKLYLAFVLQHSVATDTSYKRKATSSLQTDLLRDHPTKLLKKNVDWFA